MKHIFAIGALAAASCIVSGASAGEASYGIRFEKYSITDKLATRYWRPELKEIAKSGPVPANSAIYVAHPPAEEGSDFVVTMIQAPTMCDETGDFCRVKGFDATTQFASMLCTDLSQHGILKSGMAYVACDAKIGVGLSEEGKPAKGFLSKVLP